MAGLIHSDLTYRWGGIVRRWASRLFQVSDDDRSAEDRARSFNAVPSHAYRSLCTLTIGIYYRHIKLGHSYYFHESVNIHFAPSSHSGTKTSSVHLVPWLQVKNKTHERGSTWFLFLRWAQTIPEREQDVLCTPIA